MKVLHVNAGNEYGGGLFHILSLFHAMERADMELLVFEEGPVAKAAREQGITVHVFEQTSRYDVSVIKRLSTFLKEGQYDIVHTHGPRANLLVSRVAKRVSTIQWMVTLHSHPRLDFKGQGLKGKLFEWLNLKAIKKADHILCVSQEIAEVAHKNGTSRNQLSVVHNGIKLDPNNEPTFEKKAQFTLCAVGRLEWVKGYTYLFQAIKEAEIPDLRLQLCGQGSQEEALREEAKALGIDQSIAFNGWLPKQELAHVLNESEVMVVPSLSESFPLVALEAGQHGLALIATDVGDVKELVPDTEKGWLIEAKQVDPLAEALKEAYHLWEKNDLHQKQQAFYEWSKQFSTEKQAEETYAIYRLLIDVEQ